MNASKDKPIVIIDTSVFGNLLDRKTSQQTYDIFLEVDKDYNLAISKITVHEIIARGTSDINSILSMFKKMKEFEISDYVIVFSGFLYNIGIKGHCDSIIASTAFLNRAVILTSNQKDFREPLFTEEKCWNVNYKDDENRTASNNIYLLSSNTTKISEKILKIEYVKEGIARDLALKSRLRSRKSHTETRTSGL
ncbi:hypothetical protein KKH23_01940 [Patescibacteria group bacterium]|nr:hypothetical protein [Patescibacteria group bacterium]MBU0845942.1 hypothetical protein [Patescibacteria group bacterium]MBU1844597.1 hypothetical protein [Patescibacteria group bacterium]